MRKMCRSNVMFRERMNASSTIFQNSAVDSVSFRMCGFLQFRIRRPSTPMLKKSRDTVFWSARSCGLSPHFMPISIRRRHLFCQFIFCWALQFFFSFWLSRWTNDCFLIYRLQREVHHLGIFGPIRVSRIIFSFASNANLFCTLHFFQRRGESGVGLSQIASIPSGVRLFACYLESLVTCRAS